MQPIEDIAGDIPVRFGFPDNKSLAVQHHIGKVI
jgi:hypothetical protein